MPDARLARARKSLPSDYVYELPKSQRPLFVAARRYLSIMSSAPAITGVIDCHPADANLEAEGYGHAV